MNKIRYYEESLQYLEQDLKRENRRISSLNKIQKQLEGVGYGSLYALNEAIEDYESRRNTIKQAISKLEGILSKAK